MAAPALRPHADTDLLTAYAAHCVDLGLTKAGVNERLVAARRFLAGHRDLAAWMSRPLPARLADLGRIPLSWLLIGFAVLTGRVHTDFDLLAAKHAGRGFAAAVAAIYPDDVARLRAAATRLSWAEKWTPPYSAMACRWSWRQPDVARWPSTWPTSKRCEMRCAPARTTHRRCARSA